MKLNLRKLTVFALLCAISCGTMEQKAYCSDSISCEVTEHEQNSLHMISGKIRRIIDLALHLAGKMENKKDTDALDQIVVKLESLEPEIVNLRNDIAALLEGSTAAGKTVFTEMLDIKYEAVEKVHSVLKEFSHTLRTGLTMAANEPDAGRRTIKFCKYVEKELGQLSAPAEFIYLESKLSNLHSILKDVNAEKAEIIKELIELHNKMRAMTNSKSNRLKVYNMVNKKYPKKRKPFIGIPEQLTVQDWAPNV